MKSFKKISLRILFIISGLYIFFLVLIYFFQEKILFQPAPLPDYLATAVLPKGIEEKYINVGDGVQLHGLLLHARKPKGLVFFLHGNGGNCFSWGEGVAFITDMDYDVFVLDYRGYGKSTGSISSEAQMHTDIEKTFAQISKNYKPENVVIAGYSMGTGLATYLAMGKKIKALVLEAPYYSLAGLSDEKLPLIPYFVKKYAIETHKWIGKVQAPVYIFHGTEDALISYSHAEKLKAENNSIILQPIEGTGHNGINESAVFREKLGELLR